MDEHTVIVPGLEEFDTEGRPVRRREWAPEEILHLAKEYAKGTRVPDICKQLGRPYYSVREKIRALDLTRDRK